MREKIFSVLNLSPGILVEIDETSFNHKKNTHREWAPKNKTGALCIVEVENKITRAYACVVTDKKASIILPILVDNVAKGGELWTDKHKYYSKLNEIGYNHKFLS